MEKLDCKGQACPLPVVNAKKALAGMGEGALEVVVDNKTAMHNLENLGKSLKVETASEERGDAEFEGCAGCRCGMRGVPAARAGR